MDVAYTLRCRQTAEGKMDQMGQTGPAVLTRTAAGWRLSWEEPPEAGMGKTRTTLELTEGEALLTRTGETVTRMVFRPGQSHPVPYRTRYGDLSMTLLTHFLRWQMGEAGGRVELDYTLSLSGAPLTRARMTIEVIG